MFGSAMHGRLEEKLRTLVGGSLTSGGSKPILACAEGRLKPAMLQSS
jgi:hypothetical protein